MTVVPIRICGRELPGLAWGRRERIHLGIQRGRDVVDVVPGDAELAVFDLVVEVTTGPQGQPDFRGPWVHGRRPQRFLYLSWGEVGPDGRFEMFRRAKLHLTDLPAAELAGAVAGRGRIEGNLGLRDSAGGPLCAAVRPPRITWQLRPGSTG